MGDVRRDTAKDDVVREAKLEHFQRLMCPEAIADQHPQLTSSSLLSLRVEYTLKLLQANVRTRVPSIRARVLPPRGGKCSLVATVRGS